MLLQDAVVTAALGEENHVWEWNKLERRNEVLMVNTSWTFAYIRRLSTVLKTECNKKVNKTLAYIRHLTVSYIRLCQFKTKAICVSPCRAYVCSRPWSGSCWPLSQYWESHSVSSWSLGNHWVTTPGERIIPAGRTWVRISFGKQLRWRMCQGCVNENVLSE